MDNIEDIKNIIVTLPSSLQKYILDSNWRDTLKTIASYFGLDEEQTGIVKNETFYVLLGLNPVSAFRTSIISEAGVTYDQALKVTSETNSKIFEPVMKELKAIENDEEMPAASPAPVQASKPAPQAPANLPTQAHENILVRQMETPVYKLQDHAHMPGEHTHAQASTPTPSQPQQPQTIIDQKLSQIVKLPKEEVKVDLDAVEEKRRNSYRGNDPYREPTE